MASCSSHRSSVLPAAVPAVCPPYRPAPGPADLHKPTNNASHLAHKVHRLRAYRHTFRLSKIMEMDTFRNLKKPVKNFIHVFHPKIKKKFIYYLYVLPEFLLPLMIF